MRECVWRRGAEQYEIAVKEEKFGAECKKAGLLLVPMVVEVFGRWGQRSQEASQRLVHTELVRRWLWPGVTCAAVCR